MFKFELCTLVSAFRNNYMNDPCENYNKTSTEVSSYYLFPSSRTGLFLFILIVFIFLMAPGGNLSMILLIFLDIRLHKPMYFLLSQLSLMDLNYISTVPKMAYDFPFANESISIIGCGIQSFFFLTMACAEDCFGLYSW